MHFMTKAYLNCRKGMEYVMQDILCMPKRGLVMQPDSIRGGGKEYEFQIDRISDRWDVTELNSCK